MPALTVVDHHDSNVEDGVLVAQGLDSLLHHVALPTRGTLDQPQHDRERESRYRPTRLSVVILECVRTGGTPKHEHAIAFVAGPGLDERFLRAREEIFDLLGRAVEVLGARMERLVPTAHAVVRLLFV